MEMPYPPRRAHHRPILLGSAAAGAVAVLLSIGGHVATPGVPAWRESAAIPGATVEDDAQMPVVTSLRSHGLAEQAGVRVGDRIAAVDGEPVRDLAAVDRVIRSRRRGPVSLHIRRGDAIWTVAIDRPEPERPGKERHDPQDIAG